MENLMNKGRISILSCISLENLLLPSMRLCLIITAVVFLCFFGGVAETYSCPAFMGGPNRVLPISEWDFCHEPKACEVNRSSPINVLSGDQGFLEPFWIQNAEVQSTVLSSQDRMSSLISDYVDDIVTPQLDYLIRRLHALVGNAVAKNKYIVAGSGSYHLINAAVHSLSYSTSADYINNQSLVVASAPYYYALQSQTEMFDSIRYRWAGDSKKYVNRTQGKKFVEIVTNPNNPDGYPQKSILKGDVKIFYDRVNWWPHYTRITETADEDVMLFSLSKITGNGGIRFGWALVRDEALYQRMRNYVERSISKVSHDSGLRATAVLRTIIKGYEENIPCQKMFDVGYIELRRRWIQISHVFNQTDRFSLQKTSPEYCNFFKRVIQPAPPFAWVTCNYDEDCTEVFLEAGIQGRNGTTFGGSINQVRLSLVKRRDNFNILHKRLKCLVLGSSLAAYHMDDYAEDVEAKVM